MLNNPLSAIPRVSVCRCYPGGIPVRQVFSLQNCFSIKICPREFPAEGIEIKALSVILFLEQRLDLNGQSEKIDKSVGILLVVNIIGVEGGKFLAVKGMG